MKSLRPENVLQEKNATIKVIEENASAMCDRFIGMENTSEVVYHFDAPRLSKWTHLTFVISKDFGFATGRKGRAYAGGQAHLPRFLFYNDTHVIFSFD